MLDITDLVSKHHSKSQEVKRTIQQLYKHKEQPDFDQDKLKELYQVYLKKKTEFTELDIQYKLYLKRNGISIQSRRI